MYRFAVLSLCLSVAGALPSSKHRAKVFVSELKGSRIINGDPAEPGQFPWQVGLFIKGDDGGWFCGGSIISEEWILTAGHCVDGGRSGTIVSGTNNAFISRISEIGDFVLHGEYSRDPLANDIGLIKIAEPLLFLDAATQPIALSSDALDSNVTVTVSGYGITKDGDQVVSEILNYVTLLTISNSECQQIYGDIGDEVVCAISNSDEVKSTCNGDSGGPLVTNADSNPVHVAIVSFVSDAGCESGSPSGYTRTATYRDWIREHTGV